MPQFLPVNSAALAGDTIREAIAQQRLQQLQQEALARQVAQQSFENSIKTGNLQNDQSLIGLRREELNRPAPTPAPKLRMVRQSDGSSVMMEERPGITEAPEQPKPTAPGTLYRVRGPNGQPLFKTADEAINQTAYETPRDTGAPFTPDPEQVDSFARQLIEHRMAPSQLSSMIGGFGTQGQAVKRAVLDRAIKLDPSFNFQEAESNYAIGKNPAMQTTVRMIDNISQSIPVLRDLVGEMKLGNVRVINAATIAAKSQFGQKAAAQYELARNIISDEFAKILQGGGTGSGTSDAKMKQALDIMGKDMSPEQWEGVLTTAGDLLKTRRGTLTKGTYMEGNAPKESQTSGPAIGERREFGGRIGVWDGKGWKPE